MSIPKTRRARARFTGAEPRRDGDEEGVVMSFRPEYSRLGVERIDTYAPLGPEVCIPAVAGLGKVLRVLRASRIAVPEDPNSLIGKLDTVVQLLARREHGSELVSCHGRHLSFLISRAVGCWTVLGSLGATGGRAHLDR